MPLTLTFCKSSKFIDPAIVAGTGVKVILSALAFVVIDKPEPATNVKSSSAVSAATSVCPDTLIVLNVTTLALLLEFAPVTATKSMFCILP